MAYKNISDNMESVCRLVENWNKKGCASELERDLMLDKLKQLYEQVLYMDLKPYRTQDEPLRKEEPEPAADDMVGAVHSGRAEDIDFTVGAVVEDIEPEPDGQVDGEIISAAEGNELAGSAGPDETGDTEAPYDPGLEVFDMEASIREETMIDSPSFADADTEREEVAEEPPHPKSRIDKGVLRSLYDDESNIAPDVSMHEPARKSVENGNAEKTEPNDTAGAQEPAAEETERGKPTSEPEARNPQSAPGSRKLAPERHSIPPPSSGIATKMMPTSLKQYMGLNDKFILLSDLFDSNSTLYERTIYDLDSMTSLDDAMLYVLDNFAHKQHTDGAKLLVDLLVRKLM